MKQSVTLLVVSAAAIGLMNVSPAAGQARPSPSELTLTNAYDAFGSTESGLKHDFGFSSVIEYNGKKILFDAVISGCSHSTIETIVQETRKVRNGKIHLVVGGFHLIPYNREYIEGLAKRMKEEYGVESVAPAHCSGHLGFLIFRKVFGDQYRFFGLGERIRL